MFYNDFLLESLVCILSTVDYPLFMVQRVLLCVVITEMLFCFQKYGLDKLLVSHGHFNLLAPVNAALNQLQPGSRKVGNVCLLKLVNERMSAYSEPNNYF